MGDPVELAVAYEHEGADELVMLDISASIENRATAHALVKSIAAQLSIPFTVGGGIRNLDDIYQLLSAGADKISLNTLAVQNPELIDQAAKQFGSQCIVVAIDAHKEGEDYFVYTHSGRINTGRSAHQWAQEVVARGCGEILLTCMQRDGTGSGYDTYFTGLLGRELPVQVIASGGARTPEDFYQAFLAEIDAALAAGMFHRGEYRISEVKTYLHERGIAVRTI
jgi:cyclase